MKKYLLSIMLLFMSVGMAMAETVFNGNWTSTNENGDVWCALQLDAEQARYLNTYNEQAGCFGFLTVNMRNPSGTASVLVTYQLMVEELNENSIRFSFTGGRDVDQVSGECVANFENGKLTFIGTGSAEKELLNGLVFTKIDDNLQGAIVADGDHVASGKEPSVMDKVLDIASMVGTAAVLLFVLGHMCYLAFRGKRYKTLFTAEAFGNERQDAGLSKEMSEAEEQEAIRLMDEAFNQWTVVERTEDDEFHKPTKMKQIKASVLLLDQVIAMKPTDVDIVDRLNELVEVINSGEERHFDGSKKLIFAGILAGILTYWMMDLGVCLSLLFATALYILASRTPQFLIDKRTARGGGNIHNGIFAGVFAMLAGAQTVRTIYKHNDGSKSYSDDHSQTWIALAIGFVVIMMLGMMMMFWAFLNYIRNYVLYF